MIINPSAVGVISTLASTARFCMPGRRAATAPSTGRGVLRLPWAEEPLHLAAYRSSLLKHGTSSAIWLVTCSTGISGSYLLP